MSSCPDHPEQPESLHEKGTEPVCDLSSSPDDLPGPVAEPEQYADHLFDVVSETLRDRPGPGTWAFPPKHATKAELWDFVDRTAQAYRHVRLDLVAADAAFDELHDCIMAGNALPGPWRKHHVPRGDHDA